MIDFLYNNLYQVKCYNVNARRTPVITWTRAQNESELRLYSSCSGGTNGLALIR